MQIAVAQVNPTVGDLDGNVARALSMARAAAARGAEVLVLPAYALTGAPLSGLASSWAFVEDAQAHLARFAQDCPLLAFVSCISLAEDADGELLGVETLYAVADGSADALCTPELEEGTSCPILEVDGTTVALLLDGRYSPDVALDDVDVLVELAAAAYPDDGAAPAACGDLVRLRALASANGCAVVRTNLCGAQDETVFAGNSLVMAPDGNLLSVAPVDAEGLLSFDVGKQMGSGQVADDGLLSREEFLWRGIVTATRDYFAKNDFSDALVGLSGGIDSAVTATVAVDALGSEHVHGILMPGPYSSEGSIADADALAENLGMDTVTIPITGPMESFHEVLAQACGGVVGGLAAENLQARIRAVYLMTVSNAKGWLLLNTGNKSEAAMGFSTLNGDTAGVYAPIGEMYKTDIYALARWRMGKGASIPQACIDKAPSAELYPGATDQDRLPPYEQLDEVLFDYVENHECASELLEDGYDARLVEDVLRGLAASEFKRRLEPMGPCVTGVSLTGERAWPVTNRWVDRGGAGADAD